MGRLWRAPLAAHVAVSAVVFLGSLLLSGTQGVVSFDEGAYGAQAHSLTATGWAFDYPFYEVDPDATWFPYEHGERGENGSFIYVRQPAYPLMLSVVDRVGPDWLLLVTSSVGGWLAAAAAAVLAYMTGGTSPARVALWIATFSVLLVNGVLLWGHTWIAALAGWALVALAGAASTERPRRMVGLATLACALLAIAVLLRSEGLLVAIACLSGWVVLGLRRAVHRLWPFVAAMLASTALATFVALGAWVEAITGGGGGLIDRTGSGSLLAGRARGAWISLLDTGWGPSGGVIRACAGIAAVAMSFWMGRRLRLVGASASRDLVVASVVVVVLVSAQCALSGSVLVPGLLPAWPFAAFAVGLIGPTVRAPLETLLAAFVVAFAAMVLATQYPDGGGPQWGGRYLCAVSVPIAALVAPRLVQACQSTSRQALWALALVAIVPSMLGLYAVHQLRSGHNTVIEAVSANAETVIVTDMPWYGRASWEHPELRWALTRGEDPIGVADRIAAHYGGAVSVLRSTAGNVPSGAEDVTPPQLSDLGVQLLTFPARANP
jgi:hypothetical protein